MTASLAPLFALAGVGWLLARLGWLRPGWIEGAGDLTAKLLIPCLLFQGTAGHGLPSGAALLAVPAYFLPLLLVFLAVVRLRGGGLRPAARALACVYSNSVFVGIPVVIQALGEAALRHAFAIIAFHALTTFSLFYLADAWEGGDRRRSLRALGGALRNPIVVSLALGLLVNAAGVALPGVVGETVAMAARASLPVALLVLGGSLAGLRASGFGEVTLVCGVKLLVLPLLVLASARLLFDLDAQTASVLLVLAACPVGVNAYVVVAGHGQDARRVSATILASSLLCVASLPAWLWLSGRLLAPA